MTATISAPPAPRFALAWATLVCILAALTLSYPALSGGFLLSTVSDQYIAGYAFRDFAAQSLRAGEGIPQWNPYLFGGMPYIAAMHGDIFYPTFLLRKLLPTDVAMTWGFILHLMLAGIATYAFLRKLGVGFHAALLGGLAYMMSGPIAGLVSPGHDGKLFVSALLPLTLHVITWGVRDGKRWAWGLLALVVGLGLLTPHPQLLQYLLLASGAWALMLAFGGEGESKLARGVAMQRLGFALGAVLLGFMIGAVQYLPVREYVEWSPRVGGKGYDHAVSYSMPIEELINTYLPQYSGILDRYWGRNRIHFHSEYVGAGVLLLAVVGLGARAMADRRRLVWFFVGTFVVSLLWALGGSTPFYQLVYAIVPGTKYFRAPSTIMFITMFSTAVLAAFGAERMLAGKVDRRVLYGGVGFGVLVVVLAGVGFFQQMAEGLAKFEDTAEFIRADAGLVTLGALRSLLFVSVAAGIGIAVLAGRLPARIAGIALCAATVADAWSIERQYFKFSPRASEIYASDAAIDHMKKETQPFRVIAAPFAEGAVPRDPFLGGDAMMSHGIRQLGGYHGNEVRFWQALAGDPNQMLNPSIWGLGNVKFIYTNLDSIPDPKFKRVAGPVTNAAGSRVALYELVEPHPFAWVTTVIAKYPDAQLAAAVKAPNFPYRSVAVVDTASTTPAVQLTAIPAPLTITTNVTEYRPGKASITLSEPAQPGSALVVSEVYYPGWTATVDGQPAKAERMQLALMGVALPAGARTVEFTFDSAPVHTGRTVTYTAIAAALLLTALGIVTGRRRADA
ncbi:MAG: YfhO family protein [Gemmatimonadaceae bacterium]